MADPAGQQSPVQPLPPPPPPPPGWRPPPSPAPKPVQPVQPVRAGKLHRRRRTLLRLVGLAVLVLAVGGAWVVVRGLEARSRLTAAQGQLPALRSAIVHGDQAAARRMLTQLSADTGRARSLTTDPVWRAYEKLPFLGSSMRATRGLTVAADELSRGVLPPLLTAGGALDPASLRTAGASIQLAPFSAAKPSLDRAVVAGKAVQAEVEALPSSGLLRQVSAARSSLFGQLKSLVSTTETAATAADLVPSMLGADGPRTYFLAFQNNAEARGTGGLMGAFGLAVADHGRITVTRTGSDAELAQFAKPVVSLGPEYDSLYAGFGAATDLRESNMSPHFPDAAQIWSVMWQKQSHQHVDGVLALDPVAMSAILDATGPATLADGSKVSGSDVIELTEEKAYDTFTDPAVRKQFLQEVAHAMFAQLIGGRGSAQSLVSGLGTAVGTSHLQLWSAHPTEQAKLATLPISGVLTEAPGPYAELVVNNAAGGKLDYYLGRSLSYAAAPCTTGMRGSTITVTLTNNAPASGLSAYALTRADNPSHPYPPGQNRTLVSVYAAVGAQLTSATLDGKPVLLQATVERSHPRFSRYLELDPGTSGTLVLHLVEPSRADRPIVPVQPLVMDQVTQVVVPPCR
ncbi:MAG: hypothetical protein QOI76_820 [Frankiales bacterium]|nr:hypothetical protein [Frankiales bacterium]